MLRCGASIRSTRRNEDEGTVSLQPHLLQLPLVLAALATLGLLLEVATAELRELRSPGAELLLEGGFGLGQGLGADAVGAVHADGLDLLGQLRILPGLPGLDLGGRGALLLLHLDLDGLGGQEVGEGGQRGFDQLGRCLGLATVHQVHDTQTGGEADGEQDEQGGEQGGGDGDILHDVLQDSRIGVGDLVDEI